MNPLSTVLALASDVLIIIIIIIVGYDLVRAVDSFIFASLISRFTLILSIGTVFVHHIE